MLERIQDPSSWTLDKYDIRSFVDRAYCKVQRREVLNNIRNKMEGLIWAEANSCNDIMPCPDLRHNHGISEMEVCPVCGDVGYVTVRALANSIERLLCDEYYLAEEAKIRVKEWQKAHPKKKSKKPPEPKKRSPKR